MCTCGQTDPHEISRRTSADGAEVLFWSDGSVSSGGKRVAGPVSPGRRLAAVAASFWAAGDAALYHRSELRRLVLCARRAADPGDMRLRFRRSTERALRCGGCRYTVAGFQPCPAHLPQYLGYR